ncbi:MAG: hypothetical protein HY592_05845 [Candidatus Omnitrophica bacterium]|nr:hypothetical protein [Candidatus Omnitrophota bacterium]
MRTFKVLLFSVFFLASAQAAHAEHYGVIMGVNEYADDASDNMISCFNDAALILGQWTFSGMKRENIEVFTGETATFGNFAGAIRRFSENMHSTDTLNIHWSAHGSADTLWTYRGYITSRDLKDLLKGIPARDINIFLDICHGDSVQFKIKCKNVKIVSMVTPGEGSAKVAWVYGTERSGHFPGDKLMPPMEYGTGSFLYTRAFARGASEPVGLADAVESMNRTSDDFYDAIDTTRHVARLRETTAEGGRQDWMTRLKQGTLTLKVNPRASHDIGSGDSMRTEGSAVYNFTFSLERVPIPYSHDDEMIRYTAKVDEFMFNLSFTDTQTGQGSVIGRYQALATGILPYREEPVKFELVLQPKLEVWNIAFISPPFPIQYHASTIANPNYHEEQNGGVTLNYHDYIQCEKKGVKGSYTWDVSTPYFKNFLDAQMALQRELMAASGRFRGLPQSQIIKEQFEDLKKAAKVAIEHPVLPNSRMTGNIVTGSFYLGAQSAAPSPGVVVSGTVQAEWDFKSA